MLQYSVYARVCNGNDAVTKHRARLTGQLPANGAVRLLVVTEKQYQSIEILLGPFSPADTPFACEQLTLFLFFGKNKKRFRPQPEALFATVYYTIPRTVRELQLSRCRMFLHGYYTIPRTVRELQLKLSYKVL